jgi:hypothetical protein
VTVRPGLLAVLLGSLVSAAAAAVAVASNGEGVVVLLGTAEDEPLTGRIAAELRALGIGIEIRVVAGEEPGIDLEVEEALREGARAAVRIDAQTGRTEVSIPDPKSRRVALKQVLEGPPTAALVPVLAVRTVEFVRATLLGPRNEESRRDNGEGGQATRDASTPDGALVASPDRSGSDGTSLSSQSGLRLSLASGALFTPGGLSTSFTFGVVGRVRLFPRIGLELMGFAPLSAGSVEANQLKTGSLTWLAGTGLFLRQPVSARAGLELGAGAILAVLDYRPGMNSTLEGQASSPGIAASGYARVGADLALSRSLALRLDLLGGVTFVRSLFQETRLPLVNRVAWDRTFAAALGGVEARWF